MTAEPLTRAAGGERLWTLHPARRGEPTGSPLPAEPVVLSRLAVLHRDGSSLLLESPRAWCDVQIHEPAVAAAVAALARPTTVEGLAGMDADVADLLLSDLWAARLVVPAEGADEETQLRLRQWSPFEAWLHARSRLSATGGFHATWGLTAWADGRFPPVPARSAAFAGEAVPLDRPDLAALRKTDPSLTAVLEDRRSVRAHDLDHPLTLRQMGEFLYRCARVRGVETLDGIEHLDRPFPSGGALHELEFYVLARDVAGLERGLYHYDGHDHCLRLAAGWSAGTQEIVTAAELAADTDAPQAVVLLTARFARLMWKYEGMGYAAILKNVGVAYAVMYAVATAMGLAPCALGGGHAEAFNNATGLDYLTESVVGEFLLGNPA
jgi:SagB-type dehydrogenase family enzyme